MIFYFKNSAIINSSKDEIGNAIINELELLKYDNITWIGDNLTFKNRFWKIGSFILRLSNPDKGILEIITKGPNTEVTFQSYTSFYFDGLLIFCFLILGIFKYSEFIFVVIFLIIQILIQISSIKKGHIALIYKLKSSLS